MPLPPSVSKSDATGPLYRAVWRWHFYAGLFVAPFAIFLAVTGTVYLWQPQYEAWRYHDLLTVPAGSAAVSADVQLAAARAAVPAGWRAESLQPAVAPDETTRIGFQPPPHDPAAGAGLTVYTNPHTGAVVGQLREEDRLMNTVKQLHGTLLAGPAGQYVVELAASWALVLFLTGLYLVWPRPRFAAWGFLLPRLRATGRTFWRDLHAVPAVWCAIGTIFMLSTGLLWTNTAGGWYRTISAALGQGTPRAADASAHRSELLGWPPPLKAGLAQKIDGLASTPPAVAPGPHHPGMTMPGVASLPDGPFAHALSLDRVIALAAENHVPQPYSIGLPAGPRGVYSVISDRSAPFKRTFLHLDQYSGRVLALVRFHDLGYLAQFFSWGIIAHEGRLFGLANQILGTLLAGGVVLLAVSGLLLWRQRRPATPVAESRSPAKLPRAVVAGTLILAALLPLLAVTLVILLLLDRLLARLPWFQPAR
jgi:uncharacterized iron-regulated membrane protein